jgi:cadmium resistance protein CadD (predicted permease)
MSQEYIGSIVILLISVLKLFKIELGNEEVTAIVTGVVALWVAIRRFSKGDITVGGVRK